MRLKMKIKQMKRKIKENENLKDKCFKKLKKTAYRKTWTRDPSGILEKPENRDLGSQWDPRKNRKPGPGTLLGP